MGSEFRTVRGLYRVEQVREPERVADGGLVLTLALKRADGLETVAFRCQVGADVAGDACGDGSAMLARLSAWLEGDFEQVREAALKSIRGDGKLLEIAFDEVDPGRS